MYTPDNPSLGYYLPNWQPMTYNKWCQTIGQYRWYREDGSPRVIYNLDYDWQPIFDNATQIADTYFNSRIIYDPVEFTNEFLAAVPLSWLKYKTSLELLSGMLDGNTIDPEYFEAGYERTTEQNVNGTASSTGQAKSGARTDMNDSTNKERQLNYQQGVQALDGAINNSNIGMLGNDKATGLTDVVTQGQGTQTTGAQTTDTLANSNTSNQLKEFVKEKRYNYYDNLAFLRDRMLLMKDVKPFYEYFNDLFYTSSKMTGWW